MADDVVAAPQIREKYVGFPLYEEVKKTIYSYWVEANHYLSLIDIKRVQEGSTNVDSFGGVEYRFKAAVLKLYRACESKFVYQKDEQCVTDIGEMSLGRHADLTLSKAEELFKHLTDFIEIDGITRFEKKEMDKAHAAVEGLEE